MEESKIVIAMKKFLRDYAWDKSLSPNSSVILHSPPPLEFVAEHKNSAIEDFLNGRK